MATSISLGNSIGWAQSYCGFKSLTIGVNSEPAVSAANIITQTMLGPPFSWNWNRDKITFLTTAGTQDYVQSANTFGFIEKASYKIPAATITNTVLAAGVATYTAVNTFQTGDLATVTGTTNGSGVFNVTNQIIQSASASQFTLLNSGTPATTAVDTGTAIVGTTTEITGTVTVLGTGSERGTPNKISPQIDDNAGNITFRVLPIPDRVYSIDVIFQKKIPSLMSSTSSTWAPIPDHYSYIYQWGFLALMLAYNQDGRWAQANQKFIAGLLGVAEGLDEEQKNIFQNAWLNSITQQESTQMKVQQGVTSRGT